MFGYNIYTNICSLYENSKNIVINILKRGKYGKGNSNEP